MLKVKATIIGTLFATTMLAGTAGAAELRMSWWGGDSRHQATQEALKVCGEKHGHTIKPEFTGWSGHLEKVTTQIAGGTEADIMQINWRWLPLFSRDGSGFADLTEYADTIDLGQWTDAQLAATTVNGKLNGLPLSTTGRVFMFNKTTFDKAGLDLPKSWDDLLAAGPVIRETLGEDHYPFAAPDIDPVLVVSLIATQMTGKDLIDPATTTVAWSEEELASAIEFYGSLAAAHVMPSWQMQVADGNVPLHEDGRWTSGKFAGSYQWDSTYFKISDPLADGQELEAVGPLTLDGAKTTGIYRKPSMMFSISKNSDNKAAAAEILNCLLTEQEGIEALGATRGLPAARVAAETLVSQGAIAEKLAAANAIVMAADGPTVSPLNEHPEVRSVFKDALELYAYGEIDAATAAEEIIYGVNEAIEDYAS